MSKYMRDQLRITDETTPEDIRDFVERRTKAPMDIDGVNVWNFNNHEPIRGKLESWKEDYEIEEGTDWVIPFNLTSTWGYIHVLLPNRLRVAGRVVYSEEWEVYHSFRNIYAEAHVHKDNELNEDLEEWTRNYE